MNVKITMGDQATKNVIVIEASRMLVRLRRAFTSACWLCGLKLKVQKSYALFSASFLFWATQSSSLFILAWYIYYSQFLNSLVTLAEPKVQIFLKSHKELTKSPSWFEIYRVRVKFCPFLCPSLKTWTVIMWMILFFILDVLLFNTLSSFLCMNWRAHTT